MIGALRRLRARRTAEDAPASTWVPRLERALHENLIPFWRARAIDAERGGYHVHFTSRGAPASRTTKGLVAQARMLWLFARLARARRTAPMSGAEALDAAWHGVEFLQSRLLDERHGGYFWEVTASGEPHLTAKHAYGQAFALYALSELALATGDLRALAPADALFDLLDARCHDDRHGGYGEDFEADWTPTAAGTRGPLGRAGHRRMNTHLHLLEAMTAYWRASRRPLARERLLELMTIQSNTVVRKGLGVCTDRYTAAWVPVLDDVAARVSYGHDLENVWLLMDACLAAGVPDAPLHDLFAEIVASAVEFGFDERDGGFFESGALLQPADRRAKVWWVQAEALVCALRMFRLTGEGLYREVFARTWDFVERQMIDWDVGEWHAVVGPDGGRSGDKGHAWKAGYHTGRSLVECLEALNEPQRGAAGSYQTLTRA